MTIQGKHAGRRIRIECIRTDTGHAWRAIVDGVEIGAGVDPGERAIAFSHAMEVAEQWMARDAIQAVRP